MQRRFYFQKYEKLSSPDNLLKRLNNEATKPKFIDYILKNVNIQEKKKMIQGYNQRVSKSLDPIRNIRMDTQTLQEEYFKFITNIEDGTQINFINTEQIQEICNSPQKNQSLSKVLAFKHQLINPF
ncbi:unnamed protein product [Paramecium primaurelia]|uniref:Uncharacterized protein n=1 Tax=Paramecium primaurelia TaxID=5886 RepID=A0A8S1KXN0_PARPR|nr:unnamed protein product [Paramecium primaurelia]